MLWFFFHSQELLELGIIPKEDCVLQMVRNSFFLFFHYSVIYEKVLSLTILTSIVQPSVWRVSFLLCIQFSVKKSLF